MIMFLNLLKFLLKSVKKMSIYRMIVRNLKEFILFNSDNLKIYHLNLDYFYFYAKLYE